MSWAIGLVILFAGAMVVVLVTLLAGLLVPPIATEVVNRDAVQEAGFDVGVNVAVDLGLTYVPIGLLLSVSVWFIVMKLRRDEFHGQHRRN